MARNAVAGSETTSVVRVADAPALGAVIVEPELAQLFAWCALGAINQVLILTLAQPPAGWLARSLYHLYDAGNFIALGCVSFAAVRGTRWVSSKRPIAAARSAWFSAGLLAAVVFAVSMLTVEQDISNFAETHFRPQWQVSLVASLAFALALGATAFLRRFRAVPLRSMLAVSGGGLAVANALVLENDYFTTHLMISWLAALLIAYSVEGLAFRLLPGRVHVAGAAVLAVSGVLSLIVTPSSTVLRALYSVPSSVIPPLATRLLPESGDIDLDLVEPKYAHSPWFQDRRNGPPVPPSRAIAPVQPHVVLFFTVDALRADVLEKPEYLQELPNLAELRDSSTYFSQARSPTPSTKTSVASLLGGMYYSQLRWGRNEKGQAELLEATPRLPELLTAAGVRTLIVATSRGGILGNNGVARGFTQTQPVNHRSRKPTASTVDLLLKQLKKTPAGPLFVYSHLMEPHAPYDLAGKEGTPFQRYLREVRMVDKEIGRLRKFLDDAGLAERTTIILSADHGEGFGEHGRTGHALTVYEELIHVPLIVHVPHAPAQRIDTLVSVMDVAPTVLDLFGQPTPSAYMGQTLLPVIAGKAPAFTRPVVADAGRRIQAFYFDQGTKVIFDIGQHTTEVYDLTADPKERENLVDDDSRDIQAKIATARLFFQRVELSEPGYKPPWQKF
jgi:hypothetical protein